jgi:hypothetical protein
MDPRRRETRLVDEESSVISHEHGSIWTNEQCQTLTVEESLPESLLEKLTPAIIFQTPKRAA